MSIRRSSNLDLNFRSRLRSSCWRQRRSPICRTRLNSRSEEWRRKLRRCRMSWHQSVRHWRRSWNCARTMRWWRKPQCRSSNAKSLSYSNRRRSRWTSWSTSRLQSCIQSTNSSLQPPSNRLLQRTTPKWTVRRQRTYSLQKIWMPRWNWCSPTMISRSNPQLPNGKSEKIGKTRIDKYNSRRMKSLPSQSLAHIRRLKWSIQRCFYRTRSRLRSWPNPLSMRLQGWRTDKRRRWATCSNHVNRLKCTPKQWWRRRTTWRKKWASWAKSMMTSKESSLRCLINSRSTWLYKSRTRLRRRTNKSNNKRLCWPTCKTTSKSWKTSLRAFRMSSRTRRRYLRCSRRRSGTSRRG